MDYTDNYREAETIARKIKSRDPYEALNQMNVQLYISDHHKASGLKGCATVLLKSKYVMINGKLSDADQRLVCAHELGHIIRDLPSLSTYTFQDHVLCDRSSVTERNANFFAADFLISDKMMLDTTEDFGGDLFSTARELHVPADFLLFKVFSMIQRGYKLRMPMEIDSNFLAKPLG